MLRRGRAVETEMRFGGMLARLMLALLALAGVVAM
jgi:hypothetical protein